MNWLDSLLPSLGNISDEQLMWRAAHDDERAFEELVRRWQPAIRALCIRMTGDERFGDDLAQETFLRVYRHRQDFAQGRKFSTWLWRIALNLCHNERRRPAFRAETPFGDEPDGPHGLCTLDLGPDDQLLEEERAQLVRTALQRLPDTHRAVVVLREYEGLKLREIAEVLEIPEGTVKSRLADALTQLARHLQPLFQEEPPAQSVAGGGK